MLGAATAVDEELSLLELSLVELSGGPGELDLLSYVPFAAEFTDGESTLKTRSLICNMISIDLYGISLKSARLSSFGAGRPLQR